MLQVVEVAEQKLLGELFGVLGDRVFRVLGVSVRTGVLVGLGEEVACLGSASVWELLSSPSFWEVWVRSTSLLRLVLAVEVCLWGEFHLLRFDWRPEVGTGCAILASPGPLLRGKPERWLLLCCW